MQLGTAKWREPERGPDGHLLLNLRTDVPGVSAALLRKLQGAIASELGVRSPLVHIALPRAAHETVSPAGGGEELSATAGHDLVLAVTISNADGAPGLADGHALAARLVALHVHDRPNVPILPGWGVTDLRPAFDDERPTDAPLAAPSLPLVSQDAAAPPVGTAAQVISIARADVSRCRVAGSVAMELRSTPSAHVHHYRLRFRCCMDLPRTPQRMAANILLAAPVVLLLVLLVLLLLLPPRMQSPPVPLAD